MSDRDELCRRVQLLEDREEIARLTGEFCHGLDKHDLDRFMAIWAPDGEWAVPPERALDPAVSPRGHAAIRELVVERVWKTYSEMCHWTSNLVVEITGDSATGLCDLSGMVRRVDGNGWERIGATYRDVYVRSESGWRIARRASTFHFQSAI